MKKETKITILAGVIAVLAGIMLFGHINRVLCKKDVEGIYKNRELLGSPADQYDVILLGSSHIGMIQPQYLWENYGITSYNLYVTGDGLKRSKAALELALDHVKPRLVVLETEKYWDLSDYTRSTVYYHNTFDTFPLTFTKVKTVWDSMPDMDVRKELLFPFMLYHNRYTKLNSEDFDIPMDDTLGAALHCESEPQKPSDEVSRDQRPAEHEEGVDEGLLDIADIVEFCKGKGIDIMLVCLPLSAKESFQENMHLVDDIAADHGILFYNFQDHEPVIDFACDLRDRGHMNMSGSMKAADVLAGQILANFDIQDHRGDPGIAEHWNRRLSDYEDHLFRLAANSKEIDTFNEGLILMSQPQFCGEVFVRNSSTSLLKEDGIFELFDNIAGRDLPEFKKAVENKEDYLFIFNRPNDTIQEYTGDDIGKVFDTDISDDTYIALRKAGSKDLEFVTEIKN